MSDCVICGVEVTDELLKHVYYNPEYPEISFGPYCPDHAAQIRVCSGCHHPFLANDMKYYDKGIYMCTSCQQNIVECEGCGMPATNLRNVDGKKICESCFSKKYKECSCCGEYKDKETFITDSLSKAQYKGLFKKYNTICESCFSREKSKYKKYPIESCKRCGKFYTQGEKHSESGYCGSCAREIPRCLVCGKLHHSTQYADFDGSFEEGCGQVCTRCIKRLFRCSCTRYSRNPVKIKGIFNSAKVCTVCAEEGNNLGQCKICLGVFKLNEEGVCHNCNGTFVLNRCTNCGSIKDHHGICRVCDSSEIYNYSYKPPLFYNYTDRDVKEQENIFFGIEREITYGNGREEKYLHLKALYKSCGPNLLVAKSDSSIRGEGYEIVTQPMTLDFFHKKFPISKLFDPDIQVSTSCGMHVHVGRNALTSDIHLYKIVDFIHNNKSFMNELCGRDYNGYNEALNVKASKAVKDKGCTPRSCRINLTNDKTVELRMFAQAKNEFELKYRVEFTVAVFRWAKYIALKDNTVESFKKYVEANKSTYPALFKYLSLV